MLITWSPVRSHFISSANSVTCDILSFKTVHLNYHRENILYIFLYKKFPFTGFRRRLSCSQKLSWNSCNESNTSNPKLLFHFTNKDFSIIFKSIRGRKVSKMTKIHPGTSAVQILAGEIEIFLFQNIQTIYSTNTASNSSFFSGSKVARADSLTTHICLRPSLKISGGIPPLKLSATMSQGDNFILF